MTALMNDCRTAFLGSAALFGYAAFLGFAALLGFAAFVEAEVTVIVDFVVAIIGFVG